MAPTQRLSGSADFCTALLWPALCPSRRLHANGPLACRDIKWPGGLNYSPYIINSIVVVHIIINTG